MASLTRPCQRCGCEIPAERIEILPDTRLCLKCSQESRGEFEVTITPENLAKAGSLKKNYGSFAVKKVRKPIRRKDR